MSKHNKKEIQEDPPKDNSSKRNAIIILSIAALIILGIIFLGGGKGNIASKTGGDSPTKENVTMVLGKQIIELKAKGGYTPRVSLAKAGVPTILRFNTNGTFDCSAAVRIPSLNISKILPNSGNTDIDLGTPELGTLQGTCGMGMYPFSIEFRG